MSLPALILAVLVGFAPHSTPRISETREWGEVWESVWSGCRWRATWPTLHSTRLGLFESCYASASGSLFEYFKRNELAPTPPQSLHACIQQLRREQLELDRCMHQRGWVKHGYGPRGMPYYRAGSSADLRTTLSSCAAGLERDPTDFDRNVAQCLDVPWPSV